MRKFLAVLLAALLVAAPVFALTQGPLSAGAGANIAGGDTDWISPGNIVSSNNVYAYVDLAASGFSDWLEASTFGFTIPTGATINGIIVEVERYQLGGSGVIEDLNVFIAKGGTEVGSQHAIAGQWPSTDTYQTYGNSTDLWGTTWTAAEVNASNFGVRLTVQETGGTDANAGTVDHIRITVYYTAAASGMGKRVFVSQTRDARILKKAA